MLSNVYNSLIVSVLIQIVTGVVEIATLFVKIPSQFILIQQLLILEVTVQFIEGLFYFYWLYNFKNIVNITPNRYIDWVITTPTMLLTLVLYLIFLGYREKNSNVKPEFFSLVKENFNNISTILLLNWAMLLFGYLGEINLIPVTLGVLIGFIPFLIYFYIIYTNYAILSSDGYKIYFYFFFFWSLYGVAAVLPYNIKNTCYNILDLFAKNFFGLFLTYIILTKNF
jgi:bacteriorhodopsin